MKPDCMQKGRMCELKLRRQVPPSEKAAAQVHHRPGADTLSYRDNATDLWVPSVLPHRLLCSAILPLPSDRTAILPQRGNHRSLETPRLKSTITSSSYACISSSLPTMQEGGGPHEPKPATADGPRAPGEERKQARRGGSGRRVGLRLHGPQSE